MNSFCLAVVLALLVGGSCSPLFAKKDKSNDYQLGTFVSAAAVDDGRIASPSKGNPSRGIAPRQVSRWRIIRDVMPSLRELKGETILVLLVHPLIEQKDKVLVTRLVEIEDSGIWIEGKDLAEYLHALTKQAIIPKMPLFFVPFAQVAWITGSADYPSLSDKRLGV
jgi:hypothetical protein